jgi:hypothetical protein
MTPGRRGIAAEAVVLAAGIQATVAQLVTVRELMTRFSGNEFVIAVTLFVWLAAAGLGARLAPLALPAEALRRTRGLAAWALAMTVLPTVTLLSIRWLRAQLFAPGTSAGFYPILGFIVLTVAPYSILAGFLVPRALAVLRALRPAITVARLYGLDSVGNVAGGAFFSFLLVWCTTPMTALMSAGVPLLAAAAVLLKSSGGGVGSWRRRWREPGWCWAPACGWKPPRWTSTGGDRFSTRRRVTGASPFSRTGAKRHCFATAVRR